MNNDNDKNKNDNESFTAAGSSTTPSVVASPVASFKFKLTPAQIFQIVVSLLVHDLFVFMLATTDSPQWIFFLLLQACVPLVYAIVIFRNFSSTSSSSSSSSILTKLFCRVYLSSTAICAIVYIVIGSLWIYDDDERKAMVISLATVGLVSSLNHWYRIEVNCFQEEPKNNNNGSKTVERDLEEQDLELS